MKFEGIADIETMDDASLVASGLAGNRDAFGELVARYQSPVCALAYSACGNISQSEDLAQETFIIAWRKLGELKEPAKFKSWLYGIARNLINNAFRQQGRNPLAAAEPLDESLATTATLSNPAGQAISKEEEGILWRSLEQIPEAYREPLILFYREHQSIERVAEVMGLSEEAARQRLSRGRKLLQEQVLAFVEGALEWTNPGQMFTLGVLAALPAMTISAKAATFGAAAKGGMAVKAAGVIGIAFAFAALLFAFLQMWMDYRMKKKNAGPERLLKLLKVYYLGIASSVVVMVLLISVLMSYGGLMMKNDPWLFAGLMTGSILGYLLLVGVFATWFIRAAKKLRVESARAEIANNPQNHAWEYRSRFELFGLPFVHIRTGGWRGCNQIKTRKPVRAWIAADDAFAIGVLFAYGAVAIAPVSIGAISIGLFSYGAMAFGALAVGGFGFGIWSFAALACGWQAFGAGCAIAWNAAWGGQFAVAHHFALGEIAHAAQANNDFVKQLLKSNPFFRFSQIASQYLFMLLWVWAIPMMILPVIQWRGMGRQSQKQAAQSAR